MKEIKTVDEKPAEKIARENIFFLEIQLDNFQNKSMLKGV